jgi:hypothetical protein
LIRSSKVKCYIRGKQAIKNFREEILEEVTRRATKPIIKKTLSGIVSKKELKLENMLGKLNQNRNT